MKRSARVKLLLMGTATLALSACEQQQQQGQQTVEPGQQAGVFTSVQECVDSGVYTEQFCKTSFEQALGEHPKVAPRYQDLADCEADFGIGQCQSANAGGSNIFMPMMMGFMAATLLDKVDDALEDAFEKKRRVQPLYRPDVNRSGDRHMSGGGYRIYNPGSYRTADNVEVSERTGLTRVKPSVMDIPARTTTIARGGFGAKAASLGTISSPATVGGGSNSGG